MGYVGQDSLEDYETPVRVRVFAAHLNVAANIGTWLFRPEGLRYSTCIMEKEFYELLKLGKCLEVMKEHKDDMHHPFIINDSLGLVWMGEYSAQKDFFDMLLVIGPMFLSQTSLKYIDDKIRKVEPSVEKQLRLMQTLANVPVISMPLLNQYGKMLHYTLTSQRIQSSDFVYYEDNKLNDSFKENDERDAFEVNYERVIKGENMILQAIRDGNLSYKEILEKESTYNSGFITMTGDVIRDLKDAQLVFNALCSRAAMDGGVSINASKDIEIKFSKQIENCKSVNELKNITEKMIDGYIKAVRKRQENPLISRTIQNSCDYIRANVLYPITVESIANKIGYTTYYYSKKFKKEMGIKVTDYIKQTRIEYAKIMLLTTTKSIWDISDLLHFGTRNYFSKVFHEETGMSPAEFREKAGKS